MKISYNWLKQYVKTDLAPEELGKLLTGCGLEVESIEKVETVKGGLQGMVIGEVITKEKHPDADKLSLTTVLEHKNKTKSYWALAHKGSAPDFHNMESFIITI